jgi:methionine-rich copper-binding protein CopC
MIGRSRLILITLIIAAGPAFGHAKLLNSSPPANALLTDSPKTLTLTFSEAAQLGVLRLSSSGKDIPLVLDRGAKAASSITVALPALEPGTYEIEWTALAADDGHVTKGRFSFTVTRPPQQAH